MSFYNFAKTIANFCISAFYKIECTNLQNVPDRSFLMCCNHVSLADPIIAVMKLKRPFRFMAKAELFRNPLLKLLIQKLGAFPVDRGTGDMTPIYTSIDIIKSGGNLLIFPEGTRSKTGELLRPRSGAALIALKTGADILPVSIRFENKKKFRSKLYISYGKIIKNSDLGLVENNPRTLHSASKHIMEHIRILWEGNTIPQPENNL
ncbi:MAG: 1-acyl-sn-glycerol-3-phosphate acyltransferase [Ruminococcaceae bacterium]|nr:1-acyl-sn-glycerol-3-phosphate acyltransferase [Oscillospiraceae bacterium]